MGDASLLAAPRWRPRASSEALGPSPERGRALVRARARARLPVGAALQERRAAGDLGSPAVRISCKAKTAGETLLPATGEGLSERGFLLSARSNLAGPQARKVVTTDSRMTNGSLGFSRGAREPSPGPDKALGKVSAPSEKVPSCNGTLLQSPAAAADGGGGGLLRAAARLEGTLPPTGREGDAP